MEHLALYRQFRPMTFDEVVEQKHVVTALRQSVASGQIAHAYLFSGTRGTGKTSVAKILSRAINCLTPVNGNPCNQCDMCRGILDGSILDVIEMDAASNNSVDNIRRICDEVLFMPSRAKYKVYIVDEVHMLSSGAFNALLKTLEEPPRHAVFILATTEPHRIPATIISRCQRYDFRRIPFESIVERLREISVQNGISIRDDALETIAKLSDGALRDAISLLDQVSTGDSAQITRDDILKMTGIVDDRFLLSMADSILNGRPAEVIDLSDRLIMDGRDVLRFTLDLSRAFRDLLVVGISNRPENLVRATESSIGDMRRLSARTSKESILRVITRLSELASELKWSPDMRTSFEIALLALTSENAGQISNDAPKVKNEPTSASPVQPALPVQPASPVQAERNVPATIRSPEEIPPAIPTDYVFPEPPADDAGRESDMFEPPEPFEPDRKTSPGYPENLSKTTPLTPNLTRAAESIPAPPHPMTNLSKVTTVPPVRSANIPLPPMIPEEEQDTEPMLTHLSAADTRSDFLPPAEPEQTVTPSLSGDTPEGPGSSGSAFSDTEPGNATDEAESSETGTRDASSVAHLWKLLTKRWEDTMLMEALQLRHARPEQRGTELFLVFPDIMRAYIDRLTQTDEYKKIREDTLTLISGVSTIRMVTDSDAGNGHDSSQRSNAAKVMPDWVRQIRTFSQKNGVEIETVDDM